MQAALLRGGLCWREGCLEKEHSAICAAGVSLANGDNVSQECPRLPPALC